MAGRKPLLKIIVTPKAEDQLDQIYRYNLKERGFTPAKRYRAFLDARIESLASDYDAGKPVEGRPDLHYILMKKRTAGDGHIAVYHIDHAISSVEVWFIFHAKLDWENRL